MDAPLDDGTGRAAIVSGVNDTLRIALIAIAAIVVAKMVLPHIPGAGVIAAHL